jgi:steroid 5-alpha reductase family enzyme
MASETFLLWGLAVGVGAAVVAVVALLLWVLRESVQSLEGRVDRIWSAAVGVFVHTAAAGPQLRRAEASAVGGAPR